MVNNVVLVGRITKDPELKMSGSGREVVNFTVAVNRNFKNNQGEYEADFINCVAFGNTAKFMGNYIQKGRLLSVTGRIQTRNYQNQSGQTIYVTEVVCDNVNALDSRREQQNNNFDYQEAPAKQSPQDFMDEQLTYSTEDIADDDLPF